MLSACRSSTPDNSKNEKNQFGKFRFMPSGSTAVFAVYQLDAKLEKFKKNIALCFH